MTDFSPQPALHLLPRLYMTGDVTLGQVVPFDEGQSHYLRHVLRMEDGAMLRLFNATNGEFLANFKVHGKKGAVAEVVRLLRAPLIIKRRIHLFFSPLKKDKMDFVIEKSVELGVTDMHPVLFQRSIVREIKAERLTAQAIEAAEQCERLDIPILHPLISLLPAVRSFGGDLPLCAAIERADNRRFASVLNEIKGDIGYIVGPEGGITTEEITQLLNITSLRAVSLGDRILRAETACLYGLSLIAASFEQ